MTPLPGSLNSVLDGWFLAGPYRSAHGLSLLALANR
jgi:hypothetical protein